MTYSVNQCIISLIKVNVRKIMKDEYQNPAFLYGESIFTTMRVENGTLIDKKVHIDKLICDAKGYYNLLSTEAIYQKINELDLSFVSSGALRLTISAPSRDSLLGKFDDNELTVSTHFRELDLSVQKSVKLKLVKRVQDEIMCQFKVGSYGKELFAKRLAMKDGFDDVLFYGEDKVFETSTANIFFRKGDNLFTPKSGVYKGLTRKKILEQRNATETSILVSDLNTYDDIFLCNSLYEKISVVEIK